MIDEMNKKEAKEEFLNGSILTVLVDKDISNCYKKIIDKGEYCFLLQHQKTDEDRWNIKMVYGQGPGKRLYIGNLIRNARGYYIYEQGDQNQYRVDSSEVQLVLHIMDNFKQKEEVHLFCKCKCVFCGHQIRKIKSIRSKCGSQCYNRCFKPLTAKTYIVIKPVASEMTYRKPSLGDLDLSDI